MCFDRLQQCGAAPPKTSLCSDLPHFGNRTIGRNDVGDATRESMANLLSRSPALVVTSRVDDVENIGRYAYYCF